MPDHPYRTPPAPPPAPWQAPRVTAASATLRMWAVLYTLLPCLQICWFLQGDRIAGRTFAYHVGCAGLLWWAAWRREREAENEADEPRPDGRPDRRGV